MPRIAAPRSTSTFADHNAALFSRPWEEQAYASLYFSRLGELRERVEAAAALRWGAAALEGQVKTLDADAEATEVVVVGTLYKDMQKKPSIMDELTRDVLAERPDSDERCALKYFGPDDTLVVEDDSGRLVLKLPPALADAVLVTGMVLAVRGQLNSVGELVVDDVCPPAFAPQRALAPPPPAAAGERFVALVSGLHIGHSQQDMLPLQLLAEHLTGQLGCDEDHQLQANIVRLIIAGNATCNPATAATSGGGSLQLADPLKKVAAQEQQDLAQNVRTLDQFLTAVSASMHVDLMPGAHARAAAASPRPLAAGARESTPGTAIHARPASLRRERRSVQLPPPAAALPPVHGTARFAARDAQPVHEPVLL